MALLLALLLQAAPPLPPPERDRLEAAIRLWQDHPPPEAWRRQSTEVALSNVAASALASAGMTVGHRRWIERHDQLRERLRARIPAERESVDRDAIACAAQDLAYQLSVEEIGEVRRFMTTSAGSRFWSAAAVGHGSFQRCYQSALGLRVSDADFRAIGIRPPRPRFRPGEVVS
ncbi:MAG TPA: hypothetical protein VEW25_08065 [Allosphingosinicella sp.]|nr:hypothetical protein [Allosphingosinicella sp.]